MLPAKNQASAADTMILPPDEDDGGDDAAADAALSRILQSVGLQRLDHVGIVDAAVDADGCMGAPLAAKFQFTAADVHSDGLQALADALRRRGVTVTILFSQEIQAIDLADQSRISAIKGSFNLRFGDGAGRWLATKADMVTCTRVDGDEDQQNHTAHAPLAAMLAALHQDVVIAVDSQSESKGANWNMVEGALNSDGKSLYAGSSQAQIGATLVLKNGMTPWSSKAYVRGTLRPPLDQQTVAKLEAYMEGELRKMQAFRTAHPNAVDPSDGAADKTLDAIANGDLAAAPAGATLGPSAYATMEAAADRLAERLRPVLPAR